MDFRRGREQARRLAKGIVSDAAQTAYAPLSLKLPDLDRGHLEELVDGPEFLIRHITSGDFGDFEELFADIILLQCLLNSFRHTISRTSTPALRVETLRQRLATTLLPPPIFSVASPYVTDQDAADTASKCSYYHALTYYGLVCLSGLQRFDTSSANRDVLECYGFLAAFTDEHDIWTSARTNREAERMIGQIQASMSIDDMSKLLTQLLRDVVKPNFASSHQTRITDQARRRLGSRQSLASTRDDETRSKPWKYTQIFAPTILRHVLQQLELLGLCYIEDNWPLIIPPILTLIDDTSIRYKAAGCFDLWLLLQLSPTAMIDRTGLGQVFEETVMPCLMSLPTVTDEDASVALLNQAYPVLIKLAQVRFPGPLHEGQRLKSIDRILRHGIFKGFAHSSDHARIAETLMRYTVNAIEELGSNATKHIKSIIHMSETILADPFVTAHQPLQIASLTVLESLVTCTWARIGRYKADILKCLLFCWLALEEEGQQAKILVDVPAPDFGKAKAQTVRVARLLLEIPEGCRPTQSELDSMASADHRTEGLLLAIMDENRA